MIGKLAMLPWLVMGICSLAPAAPWQVSYEGDDFPENQGWTRECYGPWARTLADGILTLDSSADWTAFDYYHMDLPSPIAPGPGEYLYAEWRIRVTGPDDSYDNGVYVFNDVGQIANIHVAPGYVIDKSNPSSESHRAYLAPGQFHDFLLVTYDMATFDVYADASLVLQGEFLINGSHSSWVAFGDDVQGGLDLSVGEWDYVRFGVVPEPATLVVVFAGTLGAIPRQRRG